MKLASVLLAIIAFLAGLRAAYLWYRASRVQIIPMWIQDGRIEPVAPGQAQAEWIVALLETATKSGDLNRLSALQLAGDVVVPGAGDAV